MMNLFFWGTKKSGGRNELHKYTPGYLEEEVKEYAGYANCNEEQRKRQEADNYARSNIKRLRKFRDNR